MDHRRRWAWRASRPAITALAILALLVLPLTSTAATLYKCTVSGTVTYQASACPGQGPRERPTVEQLNAERKKRLEQAKATASSAPAPASAPALPLPAAPAKAAYRCDGRTHCSQMTSCAEAKYFLAHCPGVKMDGNHDGIPCEQQWCR